MYHFEYVSKKEIAYLYNAFKIAFRNAKNFNDIFLIVQDKFNSFIDELIIN